ncbi:hypothetical protein [Kitasatospora griseola]|uniref:hypothetical protein n=1 Tax=Kitasatospora griseola TaxID=2064 RepID=UPI0016717C34|nr:hypothetical protein [Kitasatospora griseola]GGQ75282.1 hypothetical protein GCM10010195_33630 [Kitasatospora griseola]
MTRTLISDTAFHLERGSGPGSRVLVVGDGAGASQAAATAPGTVARPRMPLLTEVIRAHPAGPARLVVAADLSGESASFLSHLRALAPDLDLAAVVTTAAAADSSVRGAIGKDVPLLVPERPSDIGRAAVEYASRAARRTADPVIVQGPVGQAVTGREAGLPGEGLRGVVEGASPGDGRHRWAAGRQPELPVYRTAGSPLGALVSRPAGVAMAHGLESVLRRRLARTVAKSRVLLVGYEGGAPSAAATLHTLGATVGVHDPDPIRACAAAIAGHRTLGRQEALRWADVVVDLTGELVCDATALNELRDDSVVLTPEPGWCTAPPGPLPGLAITETYEGLTVCRTARGSLHLLSGLCGSPDGGELPGPLHDLVSAELYLCVRELAARPHRRGFHHLGARECADLAHRWYQIYGVVW